MATASKATQEFVPIKEIRDGIAVLKDGTLRSVILASSINFSLKSEDERNAIIMQFQDFLNSLDFSVQCYIQSRRFDIRPYIALLEGRRKEQTTDLMKIQVDEYIQFIREFTESRSIMNKKFFVIVPYSAAPLQPGGSIASTLFGKKKEDKTQAQNSSFEESKTQLEQRISVVEQGLTRCGIRTARLGTEEMIEVYYNIFNPGDAAKPVVTS